MIRLTHPIERDGQTIAEISLRDITAGDLRGISLGSLVSGESNAIINLVPRISTPVIHKQELMQMNAKDFTKIYAALANLLVDTDDQGKD